MKSDSLPIIELKNISKIYSLRNRVKDSGGRKKFLHALSDISLKIEKGDFISVIGKNGSGKSTLLKLINELTPPSKGEIILRGNVSGMIEGGGNLQPELTGWDNIRINGKLLGLSKQQIKQKGREIIEFSELNDFIYTAVKNYSTGMKLRLSFAITVSLNAAVLLFDEVFSVGDFHFQQKCISKLLELNSEGKTIIVVTHNFKMIEYSKKTIILDEGKIIDYTDTSNVIRDNKYYFSILYQAPAYKSDFGEMSSNDKCIKLLTTEIYNAKDKSTKLCMNDELEIHTEFELLKGDKKYEIAYVIFQHGVSVLSVNSTNCSDRKNLFSSKGRYNAAIRIPGNLFNAGLFSLSIYFFTGDNHVVLMKKDAFFFPIEKGENMPEGKNSYLGPFQPLVEWNVSYEI